MGARERGAFRINNRGMLDERVCRICLRVKVPGFTLDEGQRKRMLAIISGRPEPKRNTRTTSNNPTSHLPSWICFECDRRLPSTAAFVALCRRSEQRLLRAQRLQIPFDTLHRQCKKNKVLDTTNSIKDEPSPTPFPTEDSHWDKDKEIGCQKTLLPIDIKIDESSPPPPPSPIDTDLWDDEDSELVYNENIKEEVDIKNEITVKNEYDVGKEVDVKKEIKKITKIKKKVKVKDEDDYTPIKNSIKKVNTNRSKGRPVKCRECGICGKSFLGKYVFRVHCRTHKGERHFKCSHCDVAFFKDGSLRAHIERVHINPKPKPRKTLICHQCGKISSSHSAFHLHMQSHNTDLKFQCEICKKLLRTRCGLKEHRKTHLGFKPHQCPKCDLRFVSTSGVKRHMSVHVEECTFKCETCGKMLKSKITLKQHIENIHNWVKPHVCDICGAALVTKENLKQHFRAIHSNEPGTCRICNKDVSNLREHKKSHTSEMIFQCHLCPKRYGLKRSLTAHVKTHANSESNKFACDVINCNKTFTQQNLLDYHVSQHHSEHTPYVCHYCSKGFSRLPELSKHLKNAHFRKYEDSPEDNVEMYT
ncbi:zinc finger Y-chromosomal protein-like [Arctopsyche grandis]|uniref:zinc finger Y-chromosomal protein-like n=1 Tax=Arctopsyche grandis TaxID=121162 RepID=UPI00406D7619